MKQVYLVMAEDSYSGPRVVGVVSTKAKAVAFADACNEYQTRKPKPPETTEDTPENDKLHQKYWNKFTRWQKKHPAGPSSAYDGYQFSYSAWQVDKHEWR